jgi:hypothetical protein
MLYALIRHCSHTQQQTQMQIQIAQASPLLHDPIRFSSLAFGLEDSKFSYHFFLFLFFLTCEGKDLHCIIEFNLVYDYLQGIQNSYQYSATCDASPRRQRHRALSFQSPEAPAKHLLASSNSQT